MKKGATHTEYAKLEISKKMRGKPKSNETRERMSMARTVWWSKERDKARKRKAQATALPAPTTLAKEKRMASQEVVHGGPTYISESHIDQSVIDDLQKSLQES